MFEFEEPKRGELHLHCQTTISLSSLNQSLTYSGMLEGYVLLPKLGIEGMENTMVDEQESASVTDGVVAMRAYQDMVYGEHMHCPERKQRIQDALRRYCRLDMLAQVIIWEHWRTQCGL